MLKRVSREAQILFGICAFDAISTWVLLVTRTATEANPVLAPAANVSPEYFLFVKCLTFVPAIVFAEWYRQHKPDFMRRALRAATMAYVAIYGLLVVPQLLFKFLPRLIGA